MQKRLVAALLLVLVAAWAFQSYVEAKRSAWNVIKNPETVQMLKSFVAVKKAQAYAATNGAPPEIRALFKYAERGDWQALSNSVSELKERITYWDSLGYGVRRSNDYRGAVEDLISDVAKKVGSPLPWDYWAPPKLKGTAGETIKEVYGALDVFVTGDEKYAIAFGRDIIGSIPAGSVYFGGTDPGRFIVTAMSKSQIHADPFFAITQNALADGSYLDYLRSIYGAKIYIPTGADSQKAFEDYTSDVSRRQTANQLKPGEDVTVSGGRVQVSGQVAVMQINGLLVKKIFDENPSNEFFIEESFPLDWMYPQLEPHGLIFKLNRQPIPQLSADVVQADHDYWAKYVRPIIGDWLNDDTTVAEIATFADKIFARHDYSGFNGDRRFIENAYAHKMFSKLRSSIAGLYAWRTQHANGAEKERMAREADFAFRQAWTLCPYSPEAVYRYVNFLLEQNRQADALLVAETAAKLPAVETDSQLRALVQQLKEYHKQP